MTSDAAAPPDDDLWVLVYTSTARTLVTQDQVETLLAHSRTTARLC